MTTPALPNAGQLFEDWISTREHASYDPLSRAAAVPYRYIWKRWCDWLQEQPGKPVEFAYLSAREFDDLVRILNDSLKLTVVIVTHDPETLWAISDRVIALADGVVIGNGTVHDVSKVAHPWLMEYFSKAEKDSNPD